MRRASYESYRKIVFPGTGRIASYASRVKRPDKPWTGL